MLHKFLKELEENDFLFGLVKNSRLLFLRGHVKNKYNKYVVSNMSHMIDKDSDTTPRYTFRAPSNAFAYGRAMPADLHPELRTAANAERAIAGARIAAARAANQLLNAATATPPTPTAPATGTSAASLRSPATQRR